MSLESKLNEALQHHQEKNYYQAELIYHQILQLEPDDITVLYFLGLLKFETARIDEAVVCMNEILELDPEFTEAYKSLGDMNYQKGLIDNAIIYYQNTLKLNPDYEQVYFNLGHIFADYKNQPAIAINYLEEAVQLNPNNPDTFNKLGTIYYNSFGKIQEGLVNFEKAYKLSPMNPVYRYNVGRLYVLTGNYSEGWELADSRIDVLNHHKLKLDPQKHPKWTGNENLKDKIIYVYYVAGFGDSIISSRYLPKLLETGAKVICKPQNALLELFRHSFTGIEFIDESTPDSSIECNYQIPCVSLPYAFKATPETIPFKEGYLEASKEKSEFYKLNYYNNDKFKLGIFWQTSSAENNRTLKLIDFYPFFEQKNVQIYSMQKGSGIEELKELPDGFDVINLGETFHNFADTAAAIENLDLLITADTSIAHLAGALNKPVWILIPYLCDYRWGLEDPDCKWYNSAKLFRQKTPDNWQDVFEDVIKEFNKVL